MKKNWKNLIVWPVVLLCFFIIGKNVENSFLKNLAIVSALAVEMEGEFYKVTIQVISPSAAQKEAGGELGAVVYEQKGRTFTEAIRLASQKVSRSLFLDDTEIFIMDEEIAKEKGIRDAIDFLILEPNVASNLQVFISKGAKPGDMLRFFTPIQKISARRIKEITRNIKSELGTAQPVYPNKIKNYLLNDITAQISIPYLQIEGDNAGGFKKDNIEVFDPPAKIKIGGMAFFQNDKLAGFLDPEQSKILLLLNGGIDRTLFEAGCPKGEKGFASINVSSYKSKLTPVIKEGKPPHFKINVQLEGELIESSCGTEFTFPLSREYEKVFSAKIKEEIESLINESQKVNTDYIGFGKRIYTKDPQHWKSLKEEWESVFTDLTVDTYVDVELTESGDTMRLR